ncbi:intestinal-type alkaline phosphatase 1-like [Physella acuta]|uniref:intestinal-type alkaline phosphatase 1-like n=1 Tax=Physella acuta TaxID=109671 RepID=UPI0027DDECCF|nr:intestinal-type alkaline phosphatase 1-like [Physella acuta]
MLPSLLASLLLLFCGGESIKIQTQSLNRIETTYRSKLIERANNKLFNFKAAKNVILFLVEGLDSHTMSAARKIFHQLGETSIDNINELDTYVTGFLKPQSRDSMVADIAAASSAIFNGLPERNGQMGWVEQENATCGEFDPAKKLLPNLFKLMSQAGKYTALVTNSRLTSPGVAGTYASSPDMQVESDIHLKESGCDDKRFKDIAKQLLTNQDLNVIIGSGRNYFIKNSTLVSLPLSRSDIDLTKLWQMNKILKKRTASKVVEGKLQILQHLSNPANHDLVGFLQTPESYPELTSYLQNLITFFNQKKDSKGYFIVAHTDHLALIHEATTAYRLGKMVNAILSDINAANVRVAQTEYCLFFQELLRLRVAQTEYCVFFQELLKLNTELLRLNTELLRLNTELLRLNTELLRLNTVNLIFSGVAQTEYCKPYFFQELLRLNIVSCSD